MELSEYVTMLHGELTSISRVAGEDAARAAEMISHALESSVRLTLLDVLSAAAAEITARLEDTAVEVRLVGGEPSFVVQATAPPGPDEPGQAAAGDADDAGVARVTLRLSEGLKASVEAAAADAGVSVNTWLVRAARRALDAPAGRTTPLFRGPGQRIRGTARS
jgi:HicB family